MIAENRMAATSSRLSWKRNARAKRKFHYFRNSPALFAWCKQTIMKTWFLFLLLIPLVLPAQTVHRKGNKIVYEGEVTLPGRSATQVTAALQNALRSLVKKGKTPSAVQANELTLKALGDIKLNANSTLSRMVNYTIALTAKEGGYEYRIDSVYVTEKTGGETETVRTGKQLLKEMEVSGPVSEKAEKILNEIDMNFQKLLALLKTAISKESGATQQ